MKKAVYFTFKYCKWLYNCNTSREEPGPGQTGLKGVGGVVITWTIIKTH